MAFATFTYTKGIGSEHLASIHLSPPAASVHFRSAMIATNERQRPLPATALRRGAGGRLRGCVPGTSRGSKTKPLDLVHLPSDSGTRQQRNVSKIRDLLP